MSIFVDSGDYDWILPNGIYVTDNETYPNAQDVNYEFRITVPAGLEEYPEEFVMTFGIRNNPSNWTGLPQPYVIIPVTIVQ